MWWVSRSSWENRQIARRRVLRRRAATATAAAAAGSSLDTSTQPARRVWQRAHRAAARAPAHRPMGMATAVLTAIVCPGQRRACAAPQAARGAEQQPTSEEPSNHHHLRQIEVPQNACGYCRIAPAQASSGATNAAQREPHTREVRGILPTSNRRKHLSRQNVGCWSLCAPTQSSQDDERRDSCVILEVLAFSHYCYSNSQIACTVRTIALPRSAWERGPGGEVGGAQPL